MAGDELMLANFTEETCTGTGATMALAGATSGNIAFSKSFSDGDVVAYVIEDSGGTIKVAGCGLYVSATDDITRSDNWQWNGTAVTVNPTSNITLSGGTHTIRCSIIEEHIVGMAGYSIQGQSHIHNGLLISDGGDSTDTYAADTQYAWVFLLKESANIDALNVNIKTAAAGSLASLGLSRCINGISEDVYLATTTIDSTTTGEKSLTVNKVLPAGYYLCHFVCDDATVAWNTTGNSFSASATGWTPLIEILYNNRRSPAVALTKSAVTGGTLHVDPETVTGQQDPNDKVPFFYFTRN